MGVYLTPPNRYPDRSHPPPYDPPIDVGVELGTWHAVRAWWHGHASGVSGCCACAAHRDCTDLRTYGKTLSGILHRATRWGPLR